MRKLEDAVYAGVLGKIIGVYFGRPVEGWSYARIQEQFGQIRSYVHSQVGSSIIEVDDDISGTFTFVKALREKGDRGKNVFLVGRVVSLDRTYRLSSVKRRD